MKASKGKIYLIPTLLAPNTEAQVIPPYNLELIQNLDWFFVENIRSARRFISALKLGIDISSLEFSPLDKRSQREEINPQIEKILAGKSAGVLSEAGCPGIADPGALLVTLAQERGIEVVPLIGASSILLALMASGMSGQSFVFHGYLPIDKGQRAQHIKQLEKEVQKTGQTQIFMETPYRNEQLLKDILQHSQADTSLCIAANITAPDALIQTKRIAEWRKTPTDLHKKPCIFVLGNPSR